MKAFRKASTYPGILLFLSSLFLSTAKATNVSWSTIITAQTVRGMLSTPQGREQALQFCRRLHIKKVYIEVFRDGYEADPNTLRTARDFFRQAGFEVSGAVATTAIGKPSTGWKVVACYTNQANQRRLAHIFRDAASLFNEIIIDDFFFTDCQCSECAAAKGDLSWQQYRKSLMLRVSRDDVIGPSRQVNPGVHIILKYPQWYDKFQDRGYSVSAETKLYDRIWVGTELRDPSSERWGHKQQYLGFFIYRWLYDIAGQKTGGAWFDPYGTNPIFYLDQAYISVLAGAPEILLFNLGTLDSAQYADQVNALISREDNLDALSRLVGDWRGIPAYKPPSSDPGGEPDIFDDIGMLAIPLLPTSTFPAHAQVAFFADYSLADVNFVPELKRFLEGGGTALVTEDLAHHLNQDPRLPGSAAMQLGSSEYFKTIDEGRGRIVIISDAVPKLTYVDSENRIEQPDPALRSALLSLRHTVGSFVPTSLDAPPRVAVFPMGNRVAVMNFTELPVVCHLTRRGTPAVGLKQIFSSSGAALAGNHETLRLPPHSLVVVE